MTLELCNWVVHMGNWHKVLKGGLHTSLHLFSRWVHSVPVGVQPSLIWYIAPQQERCAPNMRKDAVKCANHPSALCANYPYELPNCTARASRISWYCRDMVMERLLALFDMVYCTPTGTQDGCTAFLLGCNIPY